MDNISQTTFSNAFSSMKMFEISIKISLKFVPKGPINNITALVQIMAWHIYRWVVQEICDSSVLAMELSISCTSLSIYMY